MNRAENLPATCRALWEATKDRLGPQQLDALKNQLGELELLIQEPDDLLGYASVPAVDATALVTKLLQHHFHDNCMASWTLEEQLQAVYGYLACERQVFFSQADAYIDFRSNVDISELAKSFHTYALLSA